MMSPNQFVSPERSAKGPMAASQQVKRKNLDFTVHTPMPTPNPEYNRKEVTGNALSPQPHYYSIKGSDKSMGLSRESESWQCSVRQIWEKLSRLSQKLSQHDAILIKMSEHSLSSNKEEFKRTYQRTDPILEDVAQLKRELDALKNQSASASNTDQQLRIISEMVQASEQRMRQELSFRLRDEGQSKRDNTLLQERLDEVDKVIKRLEKGMALNSGKITNSFQRIEGISQSIDGHMDLINAEVNKAIAKIVNFVNDKVSKPLTEGLQQLTTRVETVEGDLKSLPSREVSHFGGLKSSQVKSYKQMARAQYRESLSAYGQQIIISQSTYYIDVEGYLLDRQFYYLVRDNDQRIRLDQRQIKLLMSNRLLD